MISSDSWIIHEHNIDTGTAGILTQWLLTKTSIEHTDVWHLQKRCFCSLNSVMNYSWQLYGCNHSTDSPSLSINRHLYSVRQLLMSVNNKFYNSGYSHELFMTTIWTQPPQQFSVTDYDETRAYGKLMCECSKNPLSRFPMRSWIIHDDYMETTTGEVLTYSLSSNTWIHLSDLWAVQKASFHIFHTLMNYSWPLYGDTHN